MSTPRSTVEPRNPHGPEVDLTSPPKRSIDTTSSRIESDEDDSDLDDQPKSFKKRRVPLRNRTLSGDEDIIGKDEVDEERKPTTSKRTRASKQSTSKRLPVDISTESTDEDAPSREDKRDIDNFYQSPVVKTIDGKKKEYRICKLCPGKKGFANEVTILRRHLEAHHLAKFREWSLEANYKSRLPKDVIKRKEAGKIIDRIIDEIREERLTKPAVPYSDEAFLRAAVEWLAATNQPLNAFEHPLFIEMINSIPAAVNGPRSEVDANRD